MSIKQTNGPVPQAAGVDANLRYRRHVPRSISRMTMVFWSRMWRGFQRAGLRDTQSARECVVRAMMHRDEWLGYHPGGRDFREAYDARAHG